MKPTLLTLYENGSRPFSGDLDARRCLAFERFLRAELEASGADAPMATVDRVRRRVVAGDRVGFLSGGGFILEVLPKCATRADDAETRRRFLGLLAWSGVTEWPEAPPGATGLWEEPMPSLLGSLFVRELGRRLERERFRDYRVHASSEPVVRGRIRFSEQVRRGDPPDRIACTFRTFDRDVPINRILKAALHVLARTSELSRLRGRIETLDAALGEEVARIDPVAARTLEVRWDRRTTPWRPLLSLARAILSGSSPGWKLGGATELWSFAVPLHRLWERFLARRLRVAPDVAAVEEQHVVGHLLDTPVTRAQQPDLFVRLSDGRRVLLDAKYKRGGSPSPADLRQVLVYARLAARRGEHPAAVGLVYPGVSWEVRHLGVAAWPDEVAIPALAITVPFQIPDAEEARRRMAELLLAH